jgi:L-alanine-DL-glutamate epimerase-like enolase superfamily enzyme
VRDVLTEAGRGSRPSLMLDVNESWTRKQAVRHVRDRAHAVRGVTHFLRVSALANAHDLPISPIGNTPVALLHATTSTPNHLASELQNLRPPVGVSIDLSVEDGAFILGDSPGLGVKIDPNAIAASPRRPSALTSRGPNVRPERAGRQLLVAGRGPATGQHHIDGS